MTFKQWIKKVVCFPLSVLMGAVPDNAYTTTLGASNNREDLSDTIYMIAPVDSLFTSKISTTPATATKH